MATPAAPITAAPKKKKGNGAKVEKHTITLTFEDKYASLYDELVQAAEDDDRNVSQYVLLFLRDNHKTESPIDTTE